MQISFIHYKNQLSQMPLSSSSIHIWSVDLYKFSTQFKNFFRLLSQDENKRANQYKQEKDKIYYVTARGTLRKILSLYLSTSPKKIKFYYNPYGKPFLRTQIKKHPLCFNLSHSGDLALYIFAIHRRVGIDVEKIHHINDIESIAQRFFSTSEYLKLKFAHHDQLNSFFRCWTRKEAFIKAIGNGLYYPLHEFEVSLLSNEQATLLKIRNDPLLASKWTLNSLTHFNNYEAAFVFERNVRLPNARHYFYSLP